ncbi:cyclophilin-like domain-containing protein [Zopfochytrium polystomum]|nr:cyclophilin-like domain-containing protein [Zopfochytrium polystomum]
MDITIGGSPAGRIAMQLYSDIAPRTAENFKVLCRGDTTSAVSGAKLAFKGSGFHRVIKGFMIQGGDFTNHNGTGGESIYGERFEDESFEVKHTKAGLLSMANAGKDTNGSQFFITTVPTPHLDNKHVVFGHVVKGMGVVRRIENLPTGANDKPNEAVVIADAGVYAEGEDPLAQTGTAAPEDGDVYEEYPEDQGGEKTPEALLRIAGEVKGFGNAHFKKGALKEAVAKYEKAIRYLTEIHPDPLDIEELTVEQRKQYYSTKVSCLLNAAMCHVKLGANTPAIASATSVLTLASELGSSTTATTHGIAVSSQDQCKALFRRGQAHLTRKELEEAVEDLTRAAGLAPEDKLVARELAVAQKAVRERAEKEKKAFAKMFQ